jgi:hypothetical protein
MNLPHGAAQQQVPINTIMDLLRLDVHYFNTVGAEIERWLGHAHCSSRERYSYPKIIDRADPRDKSYDLYVESS